MFLDELEKLLMFGEHLSSIVTEKEIQKKEKELGVRFPDAVRQLYLHISPTDPIFITCKMLPLQELTLQKAEDDRQYYQVIPIFREKKYIFGPAISAELKYGIDGPYWTWEGEELGLVLKVSSSKKKRNKTTMKVLTFSGWSISTCILEVLGIQIVQSLKSLVGVKNMYNSKFKRSRQVTCALWDVVKQFGGFVLQSRSLEIDEQNGVILGLRLPAIVNSCYDDYDYVWGASSDEPLEQLIKKTGAPLQWLKSQNGNVSLEEVEEPESKERPLIPISPILEYIWSFAGLTGTCTTKEKIEQAEQKLGCQLPISLREFYMYLPQSLFTSYDTIWSVSRLRRRKDGKIKFLEENQCSFYGAVQPESSLMYRQWEQEWEVAGVLDGYLVAEFIDAVWGEESTELVMEECQNIKEEQLAQNPLKQKLSDLAGISGQIATGNTKQIYDVGEGQGIAVYDRDSESLLVYTKGYNTLENLLKMLGLT